MSSFGRSDNVVLAAQQAASRGVRAGMSGADADALAREPLRAAGYGEAFSHGLGHGVGLAIHEAPALREHAAGLLPAGSVFSIEPGVYLPDWGGVRIEDLVHLTDEGPRTLTQSSTAPLVTW